ncbi:AarF/ABC1/UbiB kinase family protein [Brevibacterium sp. CS2]|uniref:ABC1 kinase family protein n=1 Tax=Brevibacterium sp. CS2 TaxID=2575923 RepID=UPI0010C777E3|nr:AarF/UbiB family protein [Brevibacterium sp. CS2]QCP06125.1 AarF/ABC1/UbiB kinase family protein [Brevibacterium sp. CS2]
MNILWSILLGLLNAVVVGVLVRRTITVGTGALRNTIVSLVIGMSLWPITLQAFEMFGISQDGDIPWIEMSFPAVMVFLLVFAWLIVVQMAILLAIELVLPSGSFTHLLRSATRVPVWYRRVSRLSQIQRILLRHGLARYMRPRIPTLRVSTREIAKTTAEAFAAAGVTFVKLGQFVATRADMVPPEFVEEFSKLQSDVPAVPFEDIRAELESAWGRPVHEVFAEFDTVPLAAASVAQVYRAVAFDGTEVVVKVQRPKLRRQVRADSDIVMTLAERLERTAGWARSIGVTAIARGFLETLAEELDYRGEVRHTIALREATAHLEDSVVRIPQVYPELSGERVIVLERIRGVPLAKAGPVLEGLSDIARADIARDLFLMVARQVLIKGIFHADLHAGNIMIDTSGRAGLIDFGSVGRIDRRDRRDITLLLLAFEHQNSEAAMNAVLDIFGTPVGIDLRSMQRDIGQIMLQFEGGMPAGSSALFGELLEFVMAQGFEMPSAVANAFRAISTLEGSLRILDPSIDLLDMVREHADELMRESRDLAESAENLTLYVGSTLPVLASLPVELSRVVKHLQDGTLDIGTSGLNIDLIKNLVRSTVDQFIQVIIATAFILGGVMMMTADFGPPLAPDLRLFTYFGAWVLLVGFVLSAVVLAPALRERRFR